jgi:FkbM family methyltransferase
MKHIHPGAVAIRLAKKHPSIARFGLGLAAQPYIVLRRRPPRLFDNLAGSIGYLVSVNARLGNGMKMRVVWNDTGGCGHEIWRSGWYEPRTVEVIGDLLQPGMTFFDIGANMGQYTLLAAGKNCKVHSFEPAPAMFEFLNENVQPVKERVRINKIALSNTEEPVTLFMAKPHNVGATSFTDQYGASGETFEVPCTTIDNYMEKNGIARIDVMKMDVEGAESAVLKGAAKLLSGPNPPVIVLEYEESAQRRFGSSCAEMTSLLTAHGYRLERITDREVIPYVPKDPEDFSFNVLARPPAASS